MPSWKLYTVDGLITNAYEFRSVFDYYVCTSVSFYCFWDIAQLFKIFRHTQHNFTMAYLYLVLPVGATPVEFHQELGMKKTGVARLP